MTLCWKNIFNHLELGAAAFVQLSIISADGRETRILLGFYFSQKLQLNLYTFWLNFLLNKSARVRAKLLLCPASAIGCNTQASTRRNNNIPDKQKTHFIVAKLLWFSQNHEIRLSHQLGTFLQEELLYISAFPWSSARKISNHSCTLNSYFFFPLCSLPSLFTLYQFLIFPYFLAFLASYFKNPSFYSGKSQSIFQPAVLKFASPMSAHPLAEVEWMGLFPHLWNAATSEVEHCSHSVFSVCLGSLEREWRITFSPGSTFF